MNREECADFYNVCIFGLLFVRIEKDQAVIVVIIFKTKEQKHTLETRYKGMYELFTRYFLFRNIQSLKIIGVNFNEKP